MASEAIHQLFFFSFHKSLKYERKCLRSIFRGREDLVCIRVNNRVLRSRWSNDLKYEIWIQSHELVSLNTMWERKRSENIRWNVKKIQGNPKRINIVNSFQRLQGKYLYRNEEIGADEQAQKRNELWPWIHLIDYTSIDLSWTFFWLFWSRFWCPLGAVHLGIMEWAFVTPLSFPYILFLVTFFSSRHTRNCFLWQWLLLLCTCIIHWRLPLF